MGRGSFATEAAGGRGTGEELFLDTGYVVALRHGRDQNHAVAAKHWRSRVRQGSLGGPLGEAGAVGGQREEGGPRQSRRRPSLLTTSFVFDVILTFLNSRGVHAEAVRVGNDLLETGLIELVHVGEDLLARGFALFSRRPDKRYSITDCTSFVLMRERGITTALTFDRNHFEAEGFIVEPHPPAT